MLRVTRRNWLRTAAAAASAAGMQAQAPDDLRKRLEPPSGRVSVVIDTDTYNEVDDQYALAWALLSPERIDVEAAYAAPFLNSRSKSAGDGMEQSYAEILRLLKFLNKTHERFAFRGANSFFTAPGKPVDSPAARDLIAKAMKPRRQPLYVVTLGTPVNVSSALLMEPKIREKIVVIWLGGTPHYWPTAKEFNLQQDLHAARVLFDSGVALVQIPATNVSEHLRTTIPELERFMKGRSALGDYLFEQFVEYYRAHTRGMEQPYAWSKVIWDISAIAWLLNPKWIPSEVVPAPSLTGEMKWQARPGAHPMRLATQVRRDPIFQDLFTKLARTSA